MCDGCALGVAGLHDWTIDGVHLCTTRLNLLELNTADPFDPVIAGRRRRAARAVAAASCAPSAASGTRCAAAGASPGSAASRWDEALSALAGGARAPPAPTGWRST